jgi:transcriptional regulator with XRE-family HTH domain
VSTTVQERFGFRVKRLRNKRGWTQVVMAERVGIDRSYLSDIERGKKNVCLPTLDVLAKTFGMSLSKLLSGI